MASEKTAEAGFSRRTPGLPLLGTSAVAATLLIVGFAYALANTSMRLQRHMTARNQWTLDQQRFAADYTRLTSAAAASDRVAYDLLLHSAQDDLTELRRDLAAMRRQDSVQRFGFLTSSQVCLAQDLAAFQNQAPTTLEACRQLLPAIPKAGLR